MEVILLSKMERKKVKYKMRNIIKDVKETVFAIIIIALICIVAGKIINRCIPSGVVWTYLKYDNTLYVLCSPVVDPEQVKEVKKTKIGTVKKEIFVFLKPKSNNESNGFRKGTEIYTSDTGQVIIKFKDEFYPLENTATADGWGNGVQIRLH